MENENNINEKIESEEPKASNSRKYWYILAVLVLIAIVVLLVSQKLPENSQNNAENGVVKERLVNLSGDERKLLESQLAGFTEQIKGLSGDTFVKERDSLLLKIAGVQYKLGKYQEALNTLEKASEEVRKETRIWALSTNIYRDMGDIAKALESAQKALGFDRENPAYWIAVIDLSTNLSNDEQKGIYEDALRLTEQNIDVVVSYAKFLEKIGDKPGAIMYWQKAGQVDDKNKSKYDAEIARLQA